MADQLSRAVTGLVVSYATTVRHEDIARFVALSGDDYEAHTDAEAMAGSRFGGIIAHGASCGLHVGSRYQGDPGGAVAGMHHDPGVARL
ncbi:MaoC/PaaZ C-terminal domain-containing protein [Sinorhizobium medicae]|uniref:MaoC/PaaZ C-terminal domain-containing protein n=1 Tax=Sinorhizobium medicae TaxID=110321 RepID=UPI0013E307A3